LRRTLVLCGISNIAVNVGGYKYRNNIIVMERKYCLAIPCPYFLLEFVFVQSWQEHY